jgi:hypothetical protein
MEGESDSLLRWEYKVVQLVSSPTPNPENASKKLGGSLSAESLKEQFPGIYSKQDGRRQINDFLNRLGADGWELVTYENLSGMPVMIFKRIKK